MHLWSTAFCVRLGGQRDLKQSYSQTVVAGFPSELWMEAIMYVLFSDQWWTSSITSNIPAILVVLTAFRLVLDARYPLCSVPMHTWACVKASVGHDRYGFKGDLSKVPLKWQPNRYLRGLGPSSQLSHFFNLCQCNHRRGRWLTG